MKHNIDTQTRNVYIFTSTHRSTHIIDMHSLHMLLTFTTVLLHTKKLLTIKHPPVLTLTPSPSLSPSLSLHLWISFSHTLSQAMSIHPSIHPIHPTSLSLNLTILSHALLLARPSFPLPLSLSPSLPTPLQCIFTI